MKIALNDSDDFVKTTAHVLKDYPSNQQVDLNIDLWSQDFRSLLANIGSSSKFFCLYIYTYIIFLT